MDKKLNILFVCGWYPSRVLSNNGDFIQRHAKAVSLLHNVAVLHIISDKNCTKNIEIESTTINGITTHIGYVKKTKNSIIKCIRFWKAYVILLKKIDCFDLVHLNEIFPFGIFVLHLKWFKKKPFIISEHWTGYTYPLSKKIPFLQKVISKIIVKKASYLCPVTKDLENSLLTFGLKGNYHTIENVVDTKKFIPLEFDDETFTIVHISNMNDNHKNVSGILKVISRIQHKIPNFNIEIIGEDSEKYIALSKDLGIKSTIIKFINHIPHNQIINHLQNPNLFVLFSNFENLPCVILESFSCGTPVISTDVGGISEYFPDNFGKLIPVKDEHRLEEEILNFYGKKYNLESKENMHTYINTYFSEQAICKKFTTLYYNTLNN